MSAVARAPIVAGVGSRDISDGERELLSKTALWMARRGFRLRSGGADGADRAWADAFARVAPERVSVCLPTAEGRAIDDRVPEGARPEIPPYPDWMVEMARAEFTFRAKTPEIGFPPYEDPELQTAYEERKRWRGVRRKARERAGDWIMPDRAYVQQLMVRNVALLHAGWRLGEGRDRVRTVDLVLGLLSDRPGGGGTGHTFRVADTLGIPTYDLRAPEQAHAAREHLERIAGQRERPPGRGR